MHRCVAYYSKLLMAQNFSFSLSSQHCLQSHSFPSHNLPHGGFLIAVALIMRAHLSATSLRSHLHNTSRCIKVMQGASSRAAAKNRPTTACALGWGKTFASETIYFTFKLRNVSTFSTFGKCKCQRVCLHLPPCFPLLLFRSVPRGNLHLDLILSCIYARDLRLAFA